MPEALTVTSLPAPRFRYSQIVKAGSHYYCSGLLGLDEDGNLVEGGPGEEALCILGMLPGLLEELHMDWSNLVQARIFCTDFSRFPEINAAWVVTFPKDRTPPARTSVGVSALPMGASVEIEFVLYKEM